MQAHVSSRRLRIIISLLFIQSCTSTIEAPVDSRKTDQINTPATVSSYEPESVSKGFHKVISGDTLYSIAWRYGLDYRYIARWNSISERYVIYPGQEIRLIPTTGSSRPEVPPQIATRPTSPATSKPPVKNKTATSTKPTVTQSIVKWRWPADGPLLTSNTPTSKNGVDISGIVGQSIDAAATGEVVYSGSGLLGYGKLIIIKHNETFLSAYAHNQNIHITEGDKVVAGQRIATMGYGKNNKPMLHFEIRKNGKPTNPLLFLPKKSS